MLHHEAEWPSKQNTLIAHSFVRSKPVASF